MVAVRVLISFHRILARGSVYDKHHVLVLHQVDDVGALAAGES